MKTTKRTAPITFEMTVLVTIDRPAIWAAEYGVDIEDVRGDVQQYLTDAMRQSTGATTCGVRTAITGS